MANKAVVGTVKHFEFNETEVKKLCMASLGIPSDYEYESYFYLNAKGDPVFALDELPNKSL